MGIPLWMNISHGAVHSPCWNLQGGYHLRAIYIPRCSDEDSAISGILHEDRGVSDLQLHTDLKKEFCLTQGLDEAWFGLDKVGIFLAFGKDSDLNLITPYFLCKVSKFWNRGTDLGGFCPLSITNRKEKG